MSPLPNRAQEGFAFGPLLSMRLGAEASLLESVRDPSKRLSESLATLQSEAVQLSATAQPADGSAHEVRKGAADAESRVIGDRESRGSELRSQRFEQGKEQSRRDAFAAPARVSGSAAGPSGEPHAPEADAPPKAPPLPARAGTEATSGLGPAVPTVPVNAAPNAPRTSDAVASMKQAGSGVERSVSAIRVVGEARTGASTSDALARGRLKQSPEQSSLRRQSFQAQIGRGLAAALKQKGGVVTLRLKPESMGHVQIKLELSGGRVQATFRAEQGSARELLSGSLDALRSTLEARGLSVERLQVEQPAEETRQEGDREHRDPRGGEGEAGRGDDPDGRPRSGRWSGGSSASASAEPAGRAEGSEARIAEDRDQLTRDDELRLDLRVGLDTIA